MPSADSLVFATRRLDAEEIVILFAAREGERRRFDGPGITEVFLGGIDREAALLLLDRGDRELGHSVRERLLANPAATPSP